MATRAAGPRSRCDRRRGSRSCSWAWARSSTGSRPSTPGASPGASSAWATCSGWSRGAEFTLEDFLEQLQQVRKMGPLGELIKLLPGVPKQALEQARPDEKRLGRFEAIILSMTPKERR